MSIENINEAEQAVQNCDTVLEEMTQAISGVKQELSTLTGTLAQVTDYFEGLTVKMNLEGYPSYNEAVAHQMAEDARDDVATSTTEVETLMQHLEAIHEKFETLVTQCENVRTRNN
jgi:Asp-tRNA(Asn)/Glu-tRNA(Gln) amidotransferase C subunit